MIESAGLLLFPPLLCFFFYACLVAVAPVPAPPPAVDFSKLPIVSSTSKGITATISATINPEGAPTRWSVDWGTVPDDYSHSVRGKDVASTGTSTDVSIALTNLPPDSTVHYRITARNDGPRQNLGRGTTRTDDGMLLTGAGTAHQPQPPGATFGEVWLSLWQWLGVGALFAALTGSIRLMPAEHRGWACGLLAAMLMWLNPAILMDTHVWPQWDVWLLPPFLLVALLASVEWWFSAGLVFGIGTMFKGQFLICAPVLLLWPLFSLRWRALIRLLLGAVLSSALLVSPWLVLSSQPFSWSLPAVKWIVRIGIAVLLGLLLPLLRQPLRRTIDDLRGAIRGTPAEKSIARRSVLPTTVAALLISMFALIVAGWPRDAELSRGWGLCLFLGILVPPWLITRRSFGVFAVSLIGVAIWMSGLLYHGDWSWETVGFENGMVGHDKLAIAPGSNGNLASILAVRFGWDIHDPAIHMRLPDLSALLPAQWTAHLRLDGDPLTLDLRQTLILAFSVALIACAAGAAINDRRNHPRFLAALVAPWMLMPNILGQMMTRYQMWGSALGALLVAISPEYALLDVLFSLLAAGMVGNQLLNFDPGRSPQLHRVLTSIAPDDGWIMLCVAALVLAMAIIPGRVTEDVAACG